MTTDTWVPVFRCETCGTTINSEAVPPGWTSRRVQGEYWGRDKDGNDLHTYWEEYRCEVCTAKGEPNVH